MPGPLFVFAFMVSTLVGAAFHLIVGGDARRLALFLLCSWFGFGVGQVVAQSLGIAIFSIGSLHIFPASLVALGCCLGVHIFTVQRT